MVYRYGRRVKVQRFRRAYLKWRLMLGLLGLLAIGATALGGVPYSIPRAFGLGKKSLPATTQRVSGAVSVRKAGSSKQPPKGTGSVAATVPLVASPVRNVGCAVFPAEHLGLATASVAELRKLSQYERLCGGAVASRSSFFTPTPTTVSQAQSSARAVAATLKAYAQTDVTPLVFMEPDSPAGDNLDLARYANGAYDGALDAFFAALQAAGVTSGMMGMWVFVPEGNLPVWSTTDPTTYAAVVTKTAQFQKKYFPSSQSSIMLDSESYPVGGTWGNGSYVSLVPYVRGIPKGLIDSFGLQGFPWTAPANQPTNKAYNPQAYLRIDLAMQAARALGVRNIWFNTGTFNKMYANQPGLTVTATPGQRQAMLDGVLQQAKRVKAQGFAVAIHLFAQNKANMAEGTDWSYWQNQPGNDANTAVFTTFAHDAAAAGLPIWLYDTTDD